MSLLGMADFDGDGLGSLVESAAAMKDDPTHNSTLLQGQAIGLFFAKQSLRTWVSCEVAAIQLGAHPLAIRDDTAGMG
ncbi:MAG: ornithine carbamoyltransferase, partial [Acidimicrobiia bacterium]|nr:ornithine carbamoyltransferase [Acidimicrobiia bacterium]